MTFAMFKKYINHKLDEMALTLDMPAKQDCKCWLRLFIAFLKGK